MRTAERILILRTSAMGDIIMSSHLAEGLRRKYPEARICWLAEPQVAPLLEHNPALDEVIVWPKMQWKQLARTRQWMALIGEMSTFIRRLRSECFTLVIDAQGLFRTRLLAWLSGADERIGFVSREPGQCLMTRLVEKGTDSHQMGSEYYHLLQQMGIASKDLKQQIHLAPATYAEAEECLKNAGINSGYVVFAPFTTRPQKHWFDQRWIELAQQLAVQQGLAVVWLGGAADQQQAERLSAVGGGTALAGKTSLSVSAAIIAKASLLVGVDTGLTHLGSAFGVPTVALFGATSPYSSTCSNRTTVLYHALPCSPCQIGRAHV